MNALILITLKAVICFTVVTDADTSFERVLQAAENVNYVSLDVYQTELPVGTPVVAGTRYDVDGDVYMCHPVA